MVMSSGWASGVNAWLAAFVLGLVGRFSDLGGIPETLTRTDVLVALGVMSVLEFFADKIPYVDSAWDAVSTVIRPVMGALLGYALTNAADAGDPGLMAAVGGVSALASHVVKAGLRLAINASPEPVSNIITSSGEDAAVTGVMALVAAYPLVAFGIALTLFLLGVLLFVALIRTIRRGLVRLDERKRRRRPDLLT